MSQVSCKAERLLIAGQIAPTLRENAEKDRERRVARVDKDGETGPDKVERVRPQKNKSEAV